MSIQINGIEETINRLKNFPNDGEILQAITEKGVDIAKNYYSGESAIVYSEINSSVGKVVAEGSQVRYIEYGTGEQGIGTYEGNLPTETISFESPNGIPQSTNGWEYNYPNEKTKKIINGSMGWFYNGEFTTGQPAKAPMWKTSRDLRDNIKKIIIDLINNKKGG